MRRRSLATVCVVSAAILAGCGVDPAAAPPASTPAKSAVAQTAASAKASEKEGEKAQGESRQSIEAPPPPPPGLPNATAFGGDGSAEDDRAAPPRGAPERAGSGGKRLRSKVKSASASSASGRLSATQVESVIDANIDQLGACVGMEGAVVSIRALVSPAGKVLEATSPKSSPDDPRVRDCVAQAFKHLEFPAASGGANAPLAFDLSLESAS